ncbi:MAG: class I SAM-dependent methyltransferase [Candidatus Omnitrophica bacterium]|nr:class I SAM-dependent methyltransferase [Candidatus Omnitrophota bacterium]
MSDKTWSSIKEDIKTKGMKLGPYFTHQVLDTPRHLLFALSRYKFAAKMLPQNEKIKVLELGCQEGIGTLVLAEAGHTVLAVDFDKEAIAYAGKNIKKDNISFREADFLGKKFGKFRAVVSLDVIEHINRSLEDKFMETVHSNLESSGFAVIGTPNITAKQYASKYSQMGHVNLYDAGRLDALLRRYFDNVFIFGANDEVVHTGFNPMCHYLIALACTPKKNISK